MNPRALIVEDDASLADLWRGYLEERGIIVEAVQKIHEAIECVRKIPPPDFIILDLRLPDSKNAEATLEYIPKMHAIHPSAHIIVATGYATPQIKDLAKKLGADGFADKTLMGTQDGCWEVISEFIESNRGKGLEGALATQKLIEGTSAKG